MSESASFLSSLKSASISTIVYSLLLTPFDVVKNTQISSFIRKNPILTARSLYSENGIRTLWRGLIPASVSTFSSNIIYYPCYETTKSYFIEKNETLGPGIAAICSRSLTVLLTLPVERLRTSIQGIGHGKFELALKGIRATMMRDIVFSFTYFTIWENLYKGVKGYEIMFDRTICIMIGALTAAGFTQPFDVIKTKVQTRFEVYEKYNRSNLFALKDILKTEGVKGLYIGSSARFSKIVIGLMIYTNLYEILKKINRDSSD